MYQLNIPVPPMWEAALGYSGAAHSIALYWEPLGDLPVVTDGQTTCNA